MTDTLETTTQVPAVALQVPHRRRTPVGGDRVVRLHLDARALATTQVRSGGGPFMEALFSLRLLRTRRPNALGAAWVRQVRPELDAANLPVALLSVLERLVDLHAMALQAPSIQDALQQLTTGGIERLPRMDPALVWVDRAPASVQSWLGQLQKGDRRALGVLVRMFLDYYQCAVEPHWRSIRSLLSAEQSRCGSVVAEAGLDRLLTTLDPKVRWRPPMLEVRGDPGETHRVAGGPGHEAPDHGRSTHVLEDRRLVLVPSAFGLDGPRALWSRRDPTLPVVLVYPVLRQMDDAAALWTTSRGPKRSALAKLLGRTQAEVLAMIADTCTTTEVAHRVGISPATASHHTGILRDAGLVVSRRNGNTVVHRLTPLGTELLGGMA